MWTHRTTREQGERQSIKIGAMQGRGLPVCLFFLSPQPLPLCGLVRDPSPLPLLEHGVQLPPLVQFPRGVVKRGGPPVVRWGAVGDGGVARQAGDGAARGGAGGASGGRAGRGGGDGAGGGGEGEGVGGVGA